MLLASAFAHSIGYTRLSLSVRQLLLLSGVISVQKVGYLFFSPQGYIFFKEVTVFTPPPQHKIAIAVVKLSSKTDA